MGRVEEKKQRKRNSIIEAAYELFQKQGYQTTAIDEVVKKAGVAKGTFYLYFRDKYDLTDQIILHKSAQLVQHVLGQVQAESVLEQLSPVDSVVRLVDKILDAMIANREVLSWVSTKITAVYDFLLAEETPIFRETADAVCALLETTGHKPEEAQRYLYVLVNLLCSVCCNAILQEKPYTVEELRPEVHRLTRRLLE